MVKNPFSKNKANTTASAATPRKPPLPNDAAALQERKAQRGQFNLNEVSLVVLNHTSGGPFKGDFTSLVEKYPHHEILIKQLLLGMQKDVGERIVAFQTHQEAYYGIHEFIECLNTEHLSFHKQVLCIADINSHVSSVYSAWYFQKHPGRTANRKRYARLKKIVETLQKKYTDNPTIGTAFTWARIPRTDDTVSESYSDELFNQIVEASLSEIKFIMKKISQYPSMIAGDVGFTSHGSTLVSRSGTITGLTRADSDRMILATMAKRFPVWPMQVSLDKALAMFCDEAFRKMDLDNPLRNLTRALQKMATSMEVKNYVTGEISVRKLEEGQMAYFSHFIFTTATLFPFLLFVIINTGWNLETVLSLTDNLKNHVTDDLIDPDQYVLIYGSKERGESAQHCRSNRTHPYSVYNILRFVESHVTKFKTSPHYRANKLWQGMAAKNLWCRAGIVAVFDQPIFSVSSSRFLARHNIVTAPDNKVQTLQVRRLRTTYETKRKEQGLSVETVSELLGHRSVDTTVLHYDSDRGSSNIRNKKIRSLQNEWVEDFSNYEARLSTSTTLAELRSAVGKQEKKTVIRKIKAEIKVDTDEEVIALLSPEGQTYITACLDSTRPTWPDAEKFVRMDDQCRFFNRCCMCKQAVIFKEALPYIARRIDDLIGLKLRIATPEWSQNYGNETAAWESILDRWKPDSDVTEAHQLSKEPKYTLPLTMR